MKYDLVSSWPSVSSDRLPFRMVSNLASDTQDRVYVLHRGEHPLCVFDQEGEYLGSLGDSYFSKSITLDLTVDPPAPMTREFWVHGLHIDHGDNIWITDLGRHIVLKLNSQGQLLMTLGTPDLSGLDNYTFNKPTSVVVSPLGEIYVADGYGNSRIMKFSSDGRYLTEWGKRGERPGEFNTPHALALAPNGNVIVADRINERVQIFDPNGHFLAQWPDIPQPDALAVLPDSSVIVGTGRGDHRLFWFNISGKLLRKFGAFKTIGYPHGILIKPDGTLYVADPVSNKASHPPTKFVPRNEIS